MANKIVQTSHQNSNMTEHLQTLFRLCIAAIVCTLAACNHSTIYNNYQDLPTTGWHQDSVLQYAVDITDCTATYDILLTIRNNDTYPYQNLWLFVSEKNTDGCILYDTIECYLADNHGHWLGTGTRTYELPLYYSTEHHFPQEGEYVFTFRQGMREEYLRGITNIGLKITKHDGEK